MKDILWRSATAFLIGFMIGISGYTAGMEVGWW